MMPEAIAVVCHEVNRAYRESLGDYSQSSWWDAPEWQKASALNGVLFHLDNPEATPEQSHAHWCAIKKIDGWEYGAIKNPDLKQHPCLLPYSMLPAEHRAKDALFIAVVKNLRAFTL